MRKCPGSSPAAGGGDIASANGAASTGGAGCGAATMNLAVNQNVLPLYSSLSTHIRPPIKSTNRLEIASPSPVPPNFLVVEVSA